MLSYSHRRAAWRPRALALAIGALLSVSSYAALAIAAPAPAGAVSYCGIWVPATTDCANVAGGSWVDGEFNENWAHAQYTAGASVCETAYDRATGALVSDRCAAGTVYSDCDLYYYYNNYIELSGHAVNDASFEELIWGHARVVEEHTCT
jgi:hypothetical protein